MSDNRALVSIGMPVYNGEQHIAQALDSLLAQDYDNFELVICDNASNDGTQEISLGYASHDSRIRYLRNERNIGAVRNFNRAFERASGEYFMWASHHDLWEPTFITRCVTRLREDASSVLCFSPVKLIDHEGNCFGIYDENIDTTHLDMLGRVHLLLWRLRWKLGAGATIYGLIRSDALRTTRLTQNTYGPDWILLLELSLLGNFVKVPEPLFSLRDAHKKDRTLQDQWNTLDPANSKKRLSWPFSSLTFGMVKGVAHARIKFWVKPFLMADIVYSMHRKFNLLSELVRECREHLKFNGFRAANSEEK
jgi:glycosyltransferase involved in cell wall biosynthesis